MNKSVERIENVIKRYCSKESIEYFNFHKNRYEEMAGVLTVYKGKLLDLGAHPFHISLLAKELGFQVVATGKNEKAPWLESLRIIDQDFSRKLDFENKEFDVVLLSEVLEHLNFHPLKLLKEAFRVLKSDGVLVLTTPNLVRFNNRVKMFFGESINWDIGDDYNDRVHWREYSLKEIILLLESAGFGEINVVYGNFDYPNMNYFVKIIDKIFSFFFKNLSGNLIITASK